MKDNWKRMREQFQCELLHILVHLCIYLCTCAYTCALVYILVHLCIYAYIYLCRAFIPVSEEQATLVYSVQQMWDISSFSLALTRV